MNAIKLVPMAAPHSMSKRWLLFTCIAALSLGFFLLFAYLWWESQTWHRLAPVGPIYSLAYESKDGHFWLMYFSSGPANGKPEKISVPIDFQPVFYYAARDSESGGPHRTYEKEISTADWLLCAAFGILPAVWTGGLLRRRLKLQRHVS
ncbi:MAG TPA: hypothetical protein VFE47_26740 [Tepidisphaeraceae bacterium]|jgi:hypothetical protein|nr:hypothetical protein [Tepidisphaeraceae bacterium]